MAGQGQCPESCCIGNEILCVSIPCPINIVLLGIDLQLEIPCIRLSSGTDLTLEQITTLLNVLTALIGGIGALIPAVV